MQQVSMCVSHSVMSDSKQWSGLPFPYPADLPNPGIKPGSPALQADSLPSEAPEKPVEITQRVHSKKSMTYINKIHRN